MNEAIKDRIGDGCLFDVVVAAVDGQLSDDYYGKECLSSMISKRSRLSSELMGVRPAAYLAEGLGDERFFFNNAGTRITFPNGKITVDAFEKYDV